MKRFINQVAIITGGARGIGKGIVKRLVTEGCEVVIFDILKLELQKTLEEFSENSRKVEGKIVDIMDEKQVQSAIQSVMEEKGQIDVLVNCAGIVGSTAINIADYSTAVFDQVLNVNLKGAFLLTKHVIPHMLQHDYGRILHLSSIGGKEGNPGMVAYAASKSGLMGLVKGVGKEYAQTGITVNSIAPAVIATEFNENTDPKMLGYMVDKIPMKRLGTIEETVALCCWVISKEASFNTGFVFDLSGGRATY